MKIYSVRKDISFQSKFVRNPIMQTLSETAKKTKTDAYSILGDINNPKRGEILNIIRASDKECQKAQMEFLNLIKNINISENDFGYLLRLLQDNFPKEPVIAKVWGLCMQRGLDISALTDSTYSIDKKCAENILDRNLLEKYKDSPQRALLMSRFDSEETGDRVLKYTEKFGETAGARRISRLPAHNDKLTNAVLNLIYRFENFILKNSINKPYISGYELDLESYWKGSLFTLEDIISKNKILDIIEKKTDLSSSLYYISDILNRTEQETETTIAGVVQRGDIPLNTANKIILSMNGKNKKFINDICGDKSLKIKPDRISQFITAFDSFSKSFLNIENLKLPDKINLLKELQSVPAEMKPIYAKYGYDIDSYISILNRMLGEKVPVVRVPQDIQKAFLSAFLSNNNLEAENIIKTYDFAKYGKEGIPLKYSRKDFCKKVNDLLSKLTDEEQNILLNHFGLTRGKNYTDGTVSFDGILNNNKLGVNNLREEVQYAANRILDEIEKFTIKNETLFEDVKIKKFFDDIIKGLPEFTAVVGKEQHSTHEYSVDIHTLKVLQSSMNNPLYSTLSDKDKTVLKMSVLLHDIGKPCGIRDEEHANTSAQYAAGILEKMNFSDDVKDRILDIIQNHHWFEGYNKGFLSVEDVAVRCRRPEDFKIYQIMAKADLENVNKYFHLGDKSGGAKTQAEFNAYMEDKMKPINEALNQIYARHNPVFYTRFIGNGKLFPVQKVKIDNEMVELRVLDLNKLPDNASLEQ